MKKQISLLLCAALFIMIAAVLTGCNKIGQATTPGYQIYYTNTDRTMLLTAKYPLKGDDTLEIVKEMFEKMRKPGEAAEQVSLVPEKLAVTVWDMTDGQLTVTFNSEYLNMDNITEVLFRAGFVETVTQLSEIKKVVFHIGSSVLKNQSGEPVGAMTRSTFINNPVGINSYQYASLSLFFSNSTGDGIVKEMRNIHYSTNITLPKVVMEQLINGPNNKNLRSVLNENCKVLGISVDNNTCTLNMNQAFYDTGKNMILPEVTIYSIVNTLCDVLGVDKVQFQIEGSSDLIYGDSLSLNGPFHRNSSLIVTQDSMTHLETENKRSELAEPQIGLEGDN